MASLQDTIMEKDHQIHELQNKNRRLHERIAKLKEQLIAGKKQLNKHKVLNLNYNMKSYR